MNAREYGEDAFSFGTDWTDPRAYFPERPHPSPRIEFAAPGLLFTGMAVATLMAASAFAAGVAMGYALAYAGPNAHWNADV